jgi:hypothetical protein
LSQGGYRRGIVNNFASFEIFAPHCRFMSHQTNGKAKLAAESGQLIGFCRFSLLCLASWSID